LIAVGDLAVVLSPPRLLRVAEEIGASDMMVDDLGASQAGEVMHCSLEHKLFDHLVGTPIERRR
jgi:hypothetical protein